MMLGMTLTSVTAIGENYIHHFDERALRFWDEKCPPDPSSLAYKHPELRSLMIFLLSGVVYPGRTSFLTRSSWARFKTRGLLGMGALPWIHLAKFSRRWCLRDTIHFHLKPPSTDLGTKSAKILKLSKE